MLIGIAITKRLRFTDSLNREKDTERIIYNVLGWVRPSRVKLLYYKVS